MTIQIFRDAHFKTNAWAGGKTTELFLYPPTAKYCDRNFDFRISTATVEVESSEFTALPGIARKLMILEGETMLTHQNQHSAKLAKFDVDSFSGDWKTTSAGKCTDFNVMTREHLKSRLAAQIVAKGTTLNYTRQQNCDWLFVYVFKGEIIINNHKTAANKGDLLVLEKPGKSALNMLCPQDSELVFTEIFAG